MSFYPMSEGELRDWAYRPDAFQGLAQDAELLVNDRCAGRILAGGVSGRVPWQTWQASGRSALQQYV